MKKIIRMSQLPEKLGLSRSSIYRLIASNQFVAKVQLSSRCVGYLESDLSDWLEKRTKQVSKDD